MGYLNCEIDKIYDSIEIIYEYKDKQGYELLIAREIENIENSLIRMRKIIAEIEEKLYGRH